MVRWARNDSERDKHTDDRGPAVGNCSPAPPLIALSLPAVGAPVRKARYALLARSAMIFVRSPEWVARQREPQRQRRGARVCVVIWVVAYFAVGVALGWVLPGLVRARRQWRERRSSNFLGRGRALYFLPTIVALCGDRAGPSSCLTFSSVGR
jgi:hypothetical protein